MIIIGYPGIGKSTLAGRDHKYIDLDSSNFKINGEKSEDWYKVYCKVAEDLSRQGYIVFVSSHSVVREALKGSEEAVAVAYPVGALEKQWITKLGDRYDKTNSETATTYTTFFFIGMNIPSRPVFGKKTDVTFLDLQSFSNQRQKEESEG